MYYLYQNFHYIQTSSSSSSKRLLKLLLLHKERHIRNSYKGSSLSSIYKVLYYSILFSVGALNSRGTAPPSLVDMFAVAQGLYQLGLHDLFSWVYGQLQGWETRMCLRVVLVVGEVLDFDNSDFHLDLFHAKNRHPFKACHKPWQRRSGDREFHTF